MAKEATKTEYKYTVATLAKDLKIDAAYVRTKLRNNEVSVNKDGVYGWNSQDEYKKVLAKLKPKEKAAAAPAKKAAKKKAAA